MRFPHAATGIGVAAMCVIAVPAAAGADPALLAKLDAFGDDAEAVAAFGVEFATRQCEALLAGGAPGLHLYSLNKAQAATAIIRNLGLRA